MRGINNYTSIPLKKNNQQVSKNFAQKLDPKAGKPLQQSKPDTPQSKPSAQSSSPSSASAPSIPTPSLPSLPKVDVKLAISEESKEMAKIEQEKKAEQKKAQEAKKLEEVKLKEKMAKSPGIFFIGGFDWLGLRPESEGLEAMTEAIEPARYYGWRQAEEIIDQIKMRDRDQPIVLVGQGLGADTAFEIAQELNSVDNGFRTVDLLVTLNSMGFDNDVIPQNVKKNLNYIPSDNGFSDDGPNIAESHVRTKVENFLHHEDHSKLDDAKDIQIEIMDQINSLI